MKYIKTRPNSRPSGEHESVRKTIFRLSSVVHFCRSATVVSLAQSSSISILSFKDHKIRLIMVLRLVTKETPVFVRYWISWDRIFLLQRKIDDPRCLYIFSSSVSWSLSRHRISRDLYCTSSCIFFFNVPYYKSSPKKFIIFCTHIYS